MSHRRNDAVKRTYQKTQQPGGYVFASQWHCNRHLQALADLEEADRQRNSAPNILGQMFNRDNYTHTDHRHMTSLGVEMVLGLIVVIIIMVVAVAS